MLNRFDARFFVYFCRVFDRFIRYQDKYMAHSAKDLSDAVTDWSDITAINNVKAHMDKSPKRLTRITCYISR